MGKLRQGPMTCFGKGHAERQYRCCHTVMVGKKHSLLWSAPLEKVPLLNPRIGICS